MMRVKSKNILITGVSSGLGYDLAKVFIARGYTVYGSVRKASDASRLSEEMGESFHPLVFDVTDFEAIDNAAQALETKIGAEGLGGLVNNAGIAQAGSLMDISMEAFRYQFEVNVFGLVKVTQAFLPLLGARENHTPMPGRILQVSSASGKFGMPFMSAYVGSKHAIEGVSHSIRRELIKFGIDVVIVGPGPVKTPIWKKSMPEEESAYFEDSVYSESLKIYQARILGTTIKKALDSAYAAKVMVDIFEKKNPKVRYSLMAGKFQNWTLPRLLPDRFLDKYIGKAIKLIK